MSQIITIDPEVSFEHREPWSCFHDNCPNDAYILVKVSEEYLRAQGIPQVPTETIIRVALCPIHYREWRAFKKTSALKGDREVNNGR